MVYSFEIDTNFVDVSSRMDEESVMLIVLIAVEFATNDFPIQTWRF